MQIAKRGANVPRHSFPPLLLALVGCLVAMIGGCRTTTDNQMDLLERELRSQEDYIYELEDYVLEYSQKLRQCRCATAQPAVSYSEPDQADPPNKGNSTTTERQPPDKRIEPDSSVEPSEGDDSADELPIPADPAPDVGEPATIDPENLDVPDLEIGVPVGELDYESHIRQASFEEWADDSIGQGSRMVDPLLIPDPADFGSEPDVQQISDELFADETPDETESLNDPPFPITPRVARQLAITQLFRGAGQQSAPTSLLTIVEALDDIAEPVDLDGEVSLMLMTTDSRAPQRLKRWNFSAEETTAAWQSSQLGDGLHLELPLDELQLPDEPLELWARLVLADGRKLLTQVAFEPPQLEALGEEMRPANSAPADVTRLTLSDTRPTEVEDDVEDIKVELASDSPELLRPTSTDGRQDRDKPRWRASLQRTDFVTQSYSTTAKGAPRWTAQPIGGRPVPPALARRPGGQSPTAPTKEKSTEKSTSNSGPKWKPYR